jgi:hypothetical protein
MLNIVSDLVNWNIFMSSLPQDTEQISQFIRRTHLPTPRNSAHAT